MKEIKLDTDRCGDVFLGGSGEHGGNCGDFAAIGKD
jgi:hypothetical protein